MFAQIYAGVVETYADVIAINPKDEGSLWETKTAQAEFIHAAFTKDEKLTNTIQSKLIF